MKDIGIYFSDFGSVQDYNHGQLGQVIVCNTESNFEPPIKGSVAIFFVPEYRNADLDITTDYISIFRKSFYSLYAGDWKSKIYDLGVVKPGKKVEDTFAAVTEIIHELVKAKVTPVIVGGSQDLTLALYKGYQKLEQTVNILDIDASLDMGNPENPVSPHNWLSKIIVHKPGYLFNYSLIGYQSYYVNPAEIALLDKMYFDSFRLGEFYADETMVEPIVRNADILSFDMNSIRSSDFRGNQKNAPHGFYGEDACRIMRYAGWSDKLTCLGIFNFSQTDVSLLHDSNLLAQMVWYFLEGFNLRKKDYPIGSKTNYTRYAVSLDDFKDEIVFYKSDKSGRWWMEVPYPKIKGMKFQRHLMVPCNYEVYQRALENEMPDLWWKTFQKLS
ncbi:MAG: formimidoylglutamase [Crocinitomicaceae bacterium]|nr:formimidoylglutamase [Crocinitomicaceae bacterium]